MHKRYLALTIFILLVASALRIVHLAELPPGPHYDEAANLIIARTVAFGGAHYFPMVENYQGREVLYYYLSAPVLMFIHDSRFALQLVGVYSNLLMVATTIALGRLMFPGRRGMVIGLAAGIMAAISLPQVLLARQAFRAITLPMMQGLALVFLWHGLKSQRRMSWVWLVMGGLLAGAAVYTYNSSRLFPFWLAIVGSSLILFDAGQRWYRLRQGLTFFIPLIAVALPFAVYAFVKPDIFFGRLYEVTGGENEVTLLESIVLHARMFFIHGEALLRYNPPGRPYFTAIEGVLLLVGLGAAVWYGLMSRSRPALERAACVLLLLSPLMVIPSVIATSGLPPNHMRSIAMTPIIFLLGGFGFVNLLHRLVNKSQLLYSTLVMLIVMGAANTVVTYQRWVSRADLYYNTDADLAAAAQWIQQEAVLEQPVYIAAQDRNHPTITVFDTPDIRWLGTDTLFLPPEDERTVIFPRSAPPPDEWREWLGAVRIDDDDLPTAPDTRPAFEAVRLSRDYPLPPKLLPVTQRNVSNEVLALAATFEDKALPAGRVTVTTAWEVIQQPTDDDLTPIVHLEDSLGNVIARAESFSVGTSTWEVREILLQRVPGLKIPIGTPPGMYTLRMTWVARSSDRYLPFSDADGDFAGVWAEVGQVEVLRPNAFPPPSDLQVPVASDIEISNGITFLGHDLLDTRFRPGEMLSLTLYWAATPANGRQAVTYMLQVNTGENTIFLDLFSPTFSQHPSNTWIDGQLITDRIQATLPQNIPAGGYVLEMHTSNGVVVSLGDVEVVGVPRMFEPPPVDQVLNEQFGTKVALYGYKIATHEDEMELTLVWQALQRPTQDYTVFVHLLDDAGQIISQRDVMPQDNAYPTSLWATGEYIVDKHYFSLNVDFHQIRIGLYRPEDGSRLPLADDLTDLLLSH